MRREKLFSKDGFYSFIVQSNALLHHEAVEYGRRVVAQLLALRGTDEPVSILDLACGGEPISIAEIMRHFPHQRFHYTGIDINPDQVEHARTRFIYPDNTEQVRVIEGNAWDLQASGLTDSYDIVFMGLNMHHGTPEEIYYLAAQLAVLIKDDGVFINHDWYRPDDQPYVRRPDHHPDDPAESFLLVSQEDLSAIAIPPVTTEETEAGACDALWRIRYREALRARLIECGGDVEGADATAQHVAMRDYPISVAEFRKIFEQVGFKVKALRYGNSDPVEAFSAMPIASRSSALMAALQQIG